MLRYTRFLPRAAAAVLLPAALAGCLSSSSDVTTPAPTTPYLRLVVGVSDATSGVDAYVNQAAAFYNGRLGAGLAYTPIAPSPRITFADDATGTVFFDQTVSSIVGAGAPFTVIAYGRVASGGAPPATATVLKDTAVTPSGSVSLYRVFNTVDYVTPPFGSTVDVFIYPSGTTRPTTPDVSGLKWGTSSAYISKATTGGTTMQVDVFTAGTESTASGPLFSGTTQVAVGSVRTLLLLDPQAVIGSTSAGAGSVLALTDQP